MTILHIMAGLGPTSGVANVARRFARRQSEQGDTILLLAPAFKWNPVYFGFVLAWKAWRAAKFADQIWVHCSWTFPVWYGAWLAKRYGKTLVVVPEASFDPKRLNNHAGWKKRLVTPLDQWVIRQADEVLALCPDEQQWIRDFEPQARVRFARVPLFLPSPITPLTPSNQRLTTIFHILFLGRAADPLKGVCYLEQAVSELNAQPPQLSLRIVSDHTGPELEADWDWCDVLCLPTLSDNFGLVVAEALERGKRVITTDGAPAWGELVVNGQELVVSEGQLVYLRGYRDGTDAERVSLLKGALTQLLACIL